MEYPYPVKDWTNVDNYKNLESFAWEFLRRNPEYQEDNYRYWNDIRSFSEEYEISFNQPCTEYKGHTDYIVHLHEPRISLFGRQGRNVPLGRVLLDKYDIESGFPNPEVDQPNIMFACGGSVPMARLLDASNSKLDMQNLEQATTIRKSQEVLAKLFNLAADKNSTKDQILQTLTIEYIIGQQGVNAALLQRIEDEKYCMAGALRAYKNTDMILRFDCSDQDIVTRQLETAQKWLPELADEHEKKQGISRVNIRKQQKKFPDYLRTLDALAAGIDLNDIAAKLIPEVENTYESGYLGKGRIESWRDSGLRFRDEDYTHIACKRRNKRSA